MRLWIAIIGSCLAGIALPADALAGHCAPPGISGVDQYFETVPGAGCNQGGTGGAGNGPGHGRGGNLPSSTSHLLASQGAAGRAVQRLVATTGPVGARSSGRHGIKAGSHPSGSNRGRPQPGSSLNINAPTPSGRGFFSALVHPIVSGSAAGGVGILLP